jgi:predicted ATP-grasp superfamily ATP-dependent carboligase
MLDAKTTGVAFMTPAATSVSDPEGAATLIETLNNVCDFMKWLLDKTKETANVKRNSQVIIE